MVINEEDFIYFIQQIVSAQTLPAALAAMLKSSHALFLNCSLRHWTHRGVFDSLWPAKRAKRALSEALVGPE